jgi:hypothetical protein
MRRKGAIFAEGLHQRNRPVSATTDTFVRVVVQSAALECKAHAWGTRLTAWMWSQRAVGLSETPVGVEPTWTGLQPVAVPSGSSVVVSASSPGIEPGLRPPQSRVRSGTLRGRVIVQ